MVQIESIRAIISAKDMASGVFNKVGRNAKGMASGVGGAAKLAGGAILGIGAAAVGAAAVITGKAITSFAAFQNKMQDVGSMIDTTTENLGDMGKSVLEISRTVPVAADELAISLFDIRSAGIEASGAMEVLRQSAILGKTGLADTKQATDLMTSSINAFGLDATKADKVANILFKSVQAGKTTVGELAQSFGAVAPIANAAGISFEELQAATSALTTAGIKTSVAQNSLKAAFQNIIKPTGEAQKKAESLGLQFSVAALESKGLSGFLDDVKEATGGNIEEMAQLFGSVEGLNAVLSLTGAQSETFTETLANLKDGTDELGTKFEEKSATITETWGRIKGILNAELIEAGGGFASGTTNMLGFFEEKLPGAINITKQALGGIGESLKKNIDFKKIVEDGKIFFKSLVGIASGLKDAWDNDFGNIRTQTMLFIEVMKLTTKLMINNFGGIIEVLGFFGKNWEFVWENIKLTTFKSINAMTDIIEKMVGGIVSAVNVLLPKEFEIAAPNLEKFMIDTELTEARVEGLRPEGSISEIVERRQANTLQIGTDFIDAIKELRDDDERRAQDKEARDEQFLEAFRAKQAAGGTGGEITIIQHNELKDDATIEKLARETAEESRLGLSSLGLDVQ